MGRFQDPIIGRLLSESGGSQHFKQSGTEGRAVFDRKKVFKNFVQSNSIMNKSRLALGPKTRVTTQNNVPVPVEESPHVQPVAVGQPTIEETKKPGTQPRDGSYQLEKVMG